MQENSIKKAGTIDGTTKSYQEMPIRKKRQKEQYILILIIVQSSVIMQAAIIFIIWYIKNAIAIVFGTKLLNITLDIVISDVYMLISKIGNSFLILNWQYGIENQIILLVNWLRIIFFIYAIILFFQDKTKEAGINEK
ncbi:hypothetical protein AwErysi_04460 [Erysipelotrichaceae bacterium]|nr:hypothetical protein AwErysi_04460 [Erysipelotrichaceae bacterium]